MNLHDTATRLAYSLDLPEADTYALLTGTGIAPYEQEWD